MERTTSIRNLESIIHNLGISIHDILKTKGEEKEILCYLHEAGLDDNMLEQFELDWMLKYNEPANKECDKAPFCDSRCPENCTCPWEKEAEEAMKDFAFEYWASEQNRCEDRDGYKRFCEYCEAGLYN